MKNDSRGKTTRAESKVRGWSEFFLFVFFRLSGSSDKDCLGRADYARETNVGRAQKKYPKTGGNGSMDSERKSTEEKVLSLLEMSCTATLRTGEYAD